MPNVSDFYPLWLKPADLPAGVVIPVTISAVTVETLHPKPGLTEQKLVLAFKGKTRRLILNTGNAGRMARIGGEDYAAWPGLVVALKRQAFTKEVETIIIEPATNGHGPQTQNKP